MGKKKSKSGKAAAKKSDSNSIDELKKKIKHQKNALNKIIKTYSK